MSKQNNKEDDLKVQLGGMGLYGTTSNVEVSGYQMSGDIENAGQLDKGFKKVEGQTGATASRKHQMQRD